MKTIEELSDKTFYQMENYSQLVIDLVEEVEEIDITEGEEKINLLKSISYQIDLVLEIIDKNLVYDIEALKTLSKIIEQQLKHLYQINSYL